MIKWGHWTKQLENEEIMLAPVKLNSNPGIVTRKDIPEQK